MFRTETAKTFFFPEGEKQGDFQFVVKDANLLTFLVYKLM